MQQIADWLESLGMSEYVQRFAENRIDFSVLPDLTDQDLEKLGVVLGDRRKMLRAIANPGKPERHARCYCCGSHRAIAHRQCRAPSGDGDVFRLGRLNGTLGTHGP
jgi:SAM domain (Sterile alpha motif)